MLGWWEAARRGLQSRGGRSRARAFGWGRLVLVVVASGVMSGCAPLTDDAFIDAFCAHWIEECPEQSEERYGSMEGCVQEKRRQYAGCSNCRFTPGVAQECLDALPSVECAEIDTYGASTPCGRGFRDCGACNDQ